MSVRRPSVQVILVVAGLVGALAGGWLVARWCFGLVLILESAGAVLVGLFREDGAVLPRRGERTIADVLEYARQAQLRGDRMAWDPAEHPRRPAGGHGGGEFASGPSGGKAGKPRRVIDPKPFMVTTEDIGKLRSDLEPGMTVEQRRRAKPRDSVMDQMDKSIAKRGWHPSPVVMYGDVLGDGHHTYAAAKERGIKKIPAIQIYAEGPGIHPPGKPASRHAEYVSRTREVCRSVGLRLA